MSYVASRRIGLAFPGLLAALLLAAPAGATSMPLAFRNADAGTLSYQIEADLGGGGSCFDEGELTSAGAFMINISCGTAIVTGDYVAEITSEGAFRVGVQNLAVDRGQETTGELEIDFFASPITSPFFSGDDPGPSALLDVPLTDASDTTTVVVGADPDFVPEEVLAPFGLCLPGVALGCKPAYGNFPEVLVEGLTVAVYPDTFLFADYDIDTDTLDMVDGGIITHEATALITNPEPETALLLGLGLAGLAAVATKRD